LALALALAASLIYRLSAAERFANDGPQLASVFVRVPDAVHWQMLYLPLARLLRSALALGDPYEPLRLLGALAGGVGVGTSFLFARGVGAPRRAALAGAAFVALARYAWFFGATVEVHALHFAAVGLAACLTLFAPWKRPLVALPIAGAAFASTWLAHGTAVLFGPGWILLVAFARARVAAPFRPALLFFGVGPFLLAALLTLMLPAKAWWTRHTGGSAELEWEIIRGYAANADRARFLAEGLLVPLGVVLPLVLLGLFRERRSARGRMLLALILPGSLFLLWWAVPEDGGYFLGGAPFHAALAALALAGVPRARLTVPLLLSAQLVLTWTSLVRFDSTLRAPERVALARACLGERGYLGKVAYLAPDISIALPGVEEVDLTERLYEGFQARTPAAELAQALAPLLEQILAGAPVALDVTYATQSWALAGRDYPAYVDAFVAALLELFRVERSSSGGWSFAVLHPL
jgi:hypothetical protein